MTTQLTSAPAVPTLSTTHELFALSDEQILEIAPEQEDPDPRSVTREEISASHNLRTAHQQNQPPEDATDSRALRNGTPDSGQAAASSTDHGTRATNHDSAEPPPWLAAQMKDPWGGEEAREFWNGVQQARSEAAACQVYRAAFATPEDARALKELYPGGVSEARAVAERGRLLEEIDRAYFGAQGNSPEQLSASRSQLAQRMLREDPAAFREMVAAGLQALQQAEQGSGAPNASSLPRLAQVLATSRGSVGAQQAAPQPGNMTASEATVAAYAAFERAANEDLERSVGTAIEHALAQALPVAQPLMAVQAGSQGQAKSPALRERLASSIRSEVSVSLQGDRQLGEQVAQILAARRFDNDSRAQIVRLISDRAQQLVPGAAKRVLNEWTQTTLAAHRSRTPPNEATVDVAPASTRSGQSSDRSSQSKGRPAQASAANRASAANSPRSVNYRKLSDEQILDM